MLIFVFDYDGMTIQNTTQPSHLATLLAAIITLSPFFAQGNHKIQHYYYCYSPLQSKLKQSWFTISITFGRAT